jgi:hypothetical protein
MTEGMKTFAGRLRWARMTAGVAARKLDWMADIGRGNTSLYEAEARLSPSIAALGGLARSLGLTMDWLLNGVGRAPSQKSIRLAAEKAQVAAKARDDARDGLKKAG